MTTTPTNPYPVDSTFHACCNGIGKHAPHCVAPPAGATPDIWQDDGPTSYRVVDGRVRNVDVNRASNEGLTGVSVYTHAVQLADGSLSFAASDGAPGVSIDTFWRDDPNGPPHDTGISVTAEEARELAAALLEAAAEIDGWAK
jgi:hypothetical protein